jgi:hypothetical protein
MIHRTYLIGAVVMMLVTILPYFSIAQEPQAQPVASDSTVAEPARSPDPSSIEEIPPVVFSERDVSLIRQARAAIGTTRAPTQEEMNETSKTTDNIAFVPPEPKQKPPPEKRYLVLSGISYVTKDDWTIWLNGQRLRPNAVPKEVIDLQVFSEYVEFKWYDDFTNQIYPVRLRPHQRFNIDTRIFLPG